jgi:hypothetical protein
MCENCAYYVDNWFYGYQVYCANPTDYWLNPVGYIVLYIFFVISLYMISNDIFFRKRN